MSTTDPVPFHMNGRLEGKGKGSFAIKGSMNLATSALDGKVNLQEIDLATIMPLVMKGGSAELQHGSLTLEASLAAISFDRIKSSGSLKLGDLQMKMSEAPTGVFQLEAAFQLETILSRQSLQVGKLDLVLNEQKAHVEARLDHWAERPQLQFTFDSPEIKLDELFSSLNDVSPPQPGSTQTQLPAREKPAAQAGPGAPAPLGDEGLASRSETPAAPTRASSTGPGPAASHSEPKPIPLDAQGTVHLGWLFYDKFLARDVACELKLQQGKLKVQPLSASLYGGELEGAVDAQLELSGPPFRCRMTIEDVLLDEIIEASSPGIRGQWAGNVTLVSEANGMGPDLGRLRSRTDITVNEAAFSGHPLVDRLAKLLQSEKLKRLHFSQITAKILTSEGIATVKELDMQGSVAQIQGSGTAGLLDGKLDLSLLLQIPEQYAGKFETLQDILPHITDDKGFVQIPLRVVGTFDNPQYRLDEGWLRKNLKTKMEKPLKKLEEEVLRELPLEERAREQLQKGLKELFQ
ncbi:MAG: AsmA-like C-terminal region-containing protein [Syntrophobacteria bacterium]